MLAPVVWRRGPYGTLMGLDAFTCTLPPRQFNGLGGLGALAQVPGIDLSEWPTVQIPADVKIVRIPEGMAGTEATLKIMKKVVLSPWGARNPQIVQLANAIRDRVPSKDYVAEADAIFQWVKANVAYKLDPAGLEWIQTPTYTTLRRAGDCDDAASLTAALSIASGHRAAFRTVKGDPGAPDRFSHVYPVIGVVKAGKTLWLPADSTQRESSLGWDPPDHYGNAVTWVIDPNQEDETWVS